MVYDGLIPFEDIVVFPPLLVLLYRPVRSMAIIVGSLHIEMFLSESESLKDRRRVVKSIMDRLRNKYKVAVADLSEQPRWRYAEIGVSCVSNSEAHVRDILQNVLRFVEGNLYGEIIHQQLEVY